MAGVAEARAGASGRGGSAGANGTGGSHAGGAAGAPGASGSSSMAGRAGASAGSAGTGSGAGAGAQLLSDDFEDGTPDGWISAGGTWAIVTDGSKVYAQQAAGTGSKLLLSAGGSTTWTDQIVEAKVKVTAFGGQSSSYFAAIYARFSTAGYYALALRSDGKIAIRSGNSTIGSAVAAGISVGTWYTVRLEAVGTTLKAYVDGVLKDTETDSSIAAGGIAVSTVNALAEFDDVKVSLP
jgi:pectate lyase